MKVIRHYISMTYLKLLALSVGSVVTIYMVIDFLEQVRLFSQSDCNPL